jgi:hypothetical protein
LKKNKLITGNLIKFTSCLFLAGLLCCLQPQNIFAQITDSVARNTIITSGDTIAPITDSAKVRFHSPRKAVIYSLICPGLGQIYNKKYWKIPFIYGAGGAFLYYVRDNHMKYMKFRKALYNNQTTQDPAVIFGYSWPYDRLAAGRDFYRRNRDLSAAGLAAIYLLNVIDAMVDANFFTYDISDDLSMKLEPAVIQNTGMNGETASLGFRINIGF